MNQKTQELKAAASTRTFIPLEAIHVASPCKADWNKMSGDAQARFCQSCEKHVYNLSSMTRDEAETLVAAKEGKLCVRFYQREDGTVLTSDCNVGVAALSVRLRESRFSPVRVLAIAACAISALLPNAMQAKAAGFVDSLRATPRIGSVVNFVSPQAIPSAMTVVGNPRLAPKPKAKPRHVMGRTAVKPKPKAPSRPLMGKPVMPTHTMGEPMMGAVAYPQKYQPKRVVKQATKIKVQRRANAKTLPRRK